jgi:NitT/TauT family transport system permease protein
MKRAAWGLWLPLTAAAIWQVAASAGLLSPLFFPSPLVLARTTGKMAANGELVRNAAATLLRTAVGFLIGSLAGLASGLWMGGVPSVRRSLDPVISALNATPRLSMLPLFMLLLGIGESVRIVVIALSSAVIVSIAAVEAVGGIHRAWVDLARNYGAGAWEMFGAVYVPAVLPQIFTGLRLALGHALVMAVSTELVIPSSGLGSMIWLAWQTFSTDRLYVAILLTAALGTVLNAGLRAMERRVIPWKSVGQG